MHFFECWNSQYLFVEHHFFLIRDIPWRHFDGNCFDKVENKTEEEDEEDEPNICHRLNAYEEFYPYDVPPADWKTMTVFIASYLTYVLY